MRAVREPPKDLLAAVAVQSPGLQGAAIAGLHGGAERAVLQPAQGETGAGGQVEERALLGAGGTEWGGGAEP